MDDFERELTHMMRGPRQQTSFDSEQRKRLYQGIRARHRSRTLWRAGGSALAVAGLSAGLALLPGLGSGSQPPADHRPLPATSPTPPPVLPTPTPPATSSAPSTSHPPMSPPVTTGPATSAAGSAPPTSTSPPATTSGSERTSVPSSLPVTSAPASPPPTSEPPSSPSFSAGLESAGSG
ncbi:cellulase [Streptomyces sp. NPDC085927]|uniref:cellulase n=1 Tax=Streptomyces sp. NPDC085927 TaxID=3365738 RepID=UPI0037D0A2F9